MLVTSALLPLSSYLILNRCVNLATLAYRKPIDISLAFDGYTHVRDYSTIKSEIELVHGRPTFYNDDFSGVQALLCDLGNYEYALCIRGTDSIKDLLFDAHFVQSTVERGQGKVHTGMRLQQKRLMMMCEKDIHRNMKHPESKLSIIGHSCGAGIGLITAHQLGKLYQNRVSTVGFGCPRVGNRAFVDSLVDILTADAICIVKHGNDPVADWPPFKHYTSPPVTVLTGGASIQGDVLRWNLRDHRIESYKCGVSKL